MKFEKEINKINRLIEVIYKKSNAIINRKYTIYGKLESGDKKERLLGDYITSFKIRKNIFRKYNFRDITTLINLLSKSIKEIEFELKNLQKNSEKNGLKIKLEINAIKHKLQWIKDDVKYLKSNGKKSREKFEIKETDILNNWLDISYCYDSILSYTRQINKKIKRYNN